MVVGLCANAFVIVPVHWAICVAAVLAPYVAYLSLDPALHAHTLQVAFRMAFYFPWALGICLINAGRPASTGNAVS